MADNNGNDIREEIFDARPGRENSNDSRVPASPPPLPKFEPAHIPARKRRSLWKIGGLLILVGLILGGVGWFNDASDGRLYLDSRGFHFSQISESLAEAAYDLQPFDEVEIGSIFWDINFIEGDGYGIEYEIPQSTEIEWEVENGKLTVHPSDEAGRALELFSFNTGASFITVYYPEGEDFEKVSLTTTTGDIFAELYDAENVTIASANGEIETVLYGRANVSASAASGNVSFKNDGGAPVEAELTAASGNVEVKDGIWNNLEVNSASGSIDIEGELFGRAVIIGVSGDVEIESSADTTPGYNISTVTGNVSVNGMEYDGHEIDISNNSDWDNVITVETISGDIDLTFED